MVGVLEINGLRNVPGAVFMPMIGSACGIRTRDLRLERAILPVLFYMARYVFRTGGPPQLGAFVPEVLFGVAPC